MNRKFHSFIRLHVMIVLTLQLLIIRDVIGQKKYRFQHIDTRDGLASMSIDGIEQDSMGYLWIQYYGGLSRYDGYSFKVYKHDPNDTLHSPGRGTVGTVITDHSDNVWLNNLGSSEKSIYQYDYQKDIFIRHQPDLKEANVRRLHFDKKNKILWIGTTNGKGLWKYDIQSKKTVNYLNPHTDSLIHTKRNHVHAIMDLDSSLLLTTKQGLWLFNKSSYLFNRPIANPNDSAFLYNEEIITILNDEVIKNDLWLNIYPRQIINLDFTFSIKAKFDYPKGFGFRFFATDMAGSIWFGSSLGLVKFNPNDSSWLKIESEFTDSFSQDNLQLSGVEIDRNNNIWLGSNNGLYVLKDRSMEFDNLAIPEAYSIALMPAYNNDLIVSAKADSNDITKKYFSTTLLPQPGNANLPLRSVDSGQFIIGELTGNTTSGYGKIRKGKNYLWIPHIYFNPTITGMRLSPTTGEITPDNPIKFEHDPNNLNTIRNVGIVDIYEDNHDQLWVATLGNGLQKIDLKKTYGSEGSITTYQHNPADPTSISNNTIWQILPGDDESLYLVTDIAVDKFKNNQFESVFKNLTTPQTIFKASNGYIYITTTLGLFHFEPNGDRYDIKKDSLVGNYEALLINGDNLGRIWMSNGNELVCYDPSAKSVLKFDTRDGLDFNNVGIYKSNSGRLVSLGFKGISIFDPSQLKISKNKITPLLTNILVNNKRAQVGYRKTDEKQFYIPKHISMLDELIIDYMHNNFSIEYAALEFTSPERNLYRHKLEGYDLSWIETNYKSRTATYTNLPVGEYTFRVMATNHHGVWSDNERTLKVIILPPPWRTWWAYTGYGFIVIGILYWGRNNIVQRERLKSNLQLEKLEHEKEHFELEKAKEVDKVKTSFFTNISHEFRTPLTLIKGPVQDLMEKYSNEPKTQEKLKLVQRNSDLLLKLINQLLDLAKLESGTMKIEKSKGNINSFISAIASSFHSLAGQKQVSIHVEVPQNSHEVLFDKDKLETILINLINNAIKFTPAGGSVTIIASILDSAHEASSDQHPVRMPDGQVSSILRLSVFDTGIGIPTEHQSKIFERFHQVSEAHQQVGTGVGLALVKEIVTLLGGSIDVHSEPGKGTEFVVTLPVKVVESEKLKVESDEVPVTLNNKIPVSLRHSKTDTPETSTTPVFENLSLTSTQTNDDKTKPHVLVVEDNHDLRAFIIDCLGDEFYFLHGENGKQGLEIASNEVPDLIISDVMMPEMDGNTMAAKIKQDIHTSHIPLILLTAKSTEYSKLEGLQSGADDYLTKPFNKHELLLKVRNAINRQLKLREKLRAELMSILPKEEVLSADEQFLKEVKENILKRLSDEHLSVESLAENMNMSRVHLYRKISALTGLSVNELIRKLRLQKASQLLHQKWGPVSQVAYEVGFSNLSYFSKVFKEEFGLLPSEFPSKYPKT